MERRLFNVFLVFAAMTACVDPVSFDMPPAASLLVVDGSISDEPGPYRVALSRGMDLEYPTSDAPVSGASITLFEDNTNAEDFVELAPGKYFTSGVIRGRIGHSYHISIRMPDGRTFESEPEEIVAGGAVTAIRYEYEERTSTKTFGPVDADVFNLYIDADAPGESNEDTYVRWKYTGTYKVETRPELHTTFLQVSSYSTPRPCSGYVIEPALGGGKLVQVGPCTCCTCWVNQYETKPQLSDTELVTDGKFSNLKVGEVLIDRDTFFEKFMIEVEQMSISTIAFDYFKMIRSQKDGAADIFQPAPGRLTGNMRATKADYPVIGLFWATSVRKETIYIPRSEVPYALPPMDVVAEACDEFYANSSTTEPANWN